MAKRKETKGKIMIYKTLHRKLKIEQNKSRKTKWGYKIGFAIMKIMLPDNNSQSWHSWFVSN
jgi:hypothetical protein